MLLSMSVMVGILAAITAPGLIAQSMRTRRDSASAETGETSHG